MVNGCEESIVREHPKIRAIFDHALEIESAEERLAYLVEACGAAFGWYLTRKAFPLPFNAFQVLRIVAATAIMALVLTFAKPLLPIGVVSFAVLAVTGCLVYAAAAFAFDIAGLRKAAVAYGARRNLPTPSTGLPSMSTRES